MRHSQKYQQKILFHLEKVNNVAQTVAFKQLQQWQSHRLLATHETLYQQARFRPAMDFFKDELYCAEHFHRRNRQLIHAVPLMCNTMPESVLEIVASAAELHSLSLELDTTLLSHIPSTEDINNLTMTQWINAYRLSNNSQQRARQLDLIELLGNELAKAVTKPMVRSLLTWARLPAKLAGFEDIHHFVCTGFHAFEHLENPDDFLVPVLTTERALSREWFQPDTAS